MYQPWNNNIFFEIEPAAHSSENQKFLFQYSNVFVRCMINFVWWHSVPILFHANCICQSCWCSWLDITDSSLGWYTMSHFGGGTELKSNISNRSLSPDKYRIAFPGWNYFIPRSQIWERWWRSSNKEKVETQMWNIHCKNWNRQFRLGLVNRKWWNSQLKVEQWGKANKKVWIVCIEIMRRG